MDAHDLLSTRLERLFESYLRSKDRSELSKELKELKEQVAEAKEEIRRVSRVFKALSHPTRLKILKLLSIREMCVCEMMAILKATQPTVSHHLSILKNIGLIEERREGKWIFYGITKTEIAEHIQQIIQLV